MPIGREREKVLYGLGAARGRAHRYTLYRWAVGIAFTVGIALLPLLGILRFDLWGGRHLILGREVGAVEAAKAFAFPFLAVNIAIVLASRFAGRYLCGFVCPVGSLGRLGEWIHWRRRRGKDRAMGLTALALLCLLLGAITFSFWVDWRVFRDGSGTARALSAAFLLGTSVGLFALVQWMGLRFCRELCPSGVYFAVLGPKTWSGIEFANPDACTECHACETVCPMDLSPRELGAPPSRGGVGFYPDGLSNHALCIRCGDCVSACEATTVRGGEPTPLRMGWLGAESPADEEAQEAR